MSEVIAAFFLLAGTLFLFLGSLGIVRMPDLYCRLHAQGVAATFGVVGVVIGAMVSLGSLAALVEGLLVIAFQFLTGPVATHVLARAALHRGIPRWVR